LPIATPRALQTESAAERLKNLLAAKPDAVGIRVGIKTRKWSLLSHGAAGIHDRRGTVGIHPCCRCIESLRFIPLAGGCNGQSYTMNYAAEKSAKDEEVVAKGVRVLIEPAALMKVVGTTMDWKEDDLSAQFVFSNPNAKSVCGCGESFNT
jgi:iron-sulfur cluster assembly protein